MRVFRTLRIKLAMFLRVLWLNWRDIGNPGAGGAEVFTHEVARRLVDYGCDVTLFTSMYCGAQTEEEMDRVRIVRRGGRRSVYIEAARFYQKQPRVRGRYDVVIDAINTIPFFAPLYVHSTSVVALTYQLTGEIFLREFPPLIGQTLYALERFVHGMIYSRCSAIMTLSGSVREELGEIGFSSSDIYVAEPGVDYDFYTPGSKADHPTVLYLNRVVPYKNVHHAVKAFALVKEQIPDARLEIVGCRGNRYETQLAALVKQLGLEQSVAFRPFVVGEIKREYLRKAWVHVLPSIKEGWGISVIEAASCETPTVAYDVSGLRDSVCDNMTGILAPAGDFRALAAAIVQILRSDDLRARMSRMARKWALRFSWDRTAKIAMSGLEHAVKTFEQGHIAAAN